MVPAPRRLPLLWSYPEEVQQSKVALHVMSSMTASLPSLLPPGPVHVIGVCCVYCVCVCVVCVCCVLCGVCVLCLVWCVCVVCVCVCCVCMCVLCGVNVCGERGRGARFNRLRQLIDCLPRIGSQS